MWPWPYASTRPSRRFASSIVCSPRRNPVRAPRRRYGAFDMDSIPPATTSRASPATICVDASMTLFSAEPQTLLIVVHGTLSGIPARSDACRAGACPTPAWTTFPMNTSSTSAARTPARSSAQRIAIAPSSGAESDARAPGYVLAVRADLVAEGRELVQAIFGRSEVRIEELDEPGQDLAVRAVPPVEALELVHLLQREPQHLQLLDELQAPEVVVGVDATPAFDALHGVEEAELLVVADRALGQAEALGDLPDPVAGD